MRGRVKVERLVPKGTTKAVANIFGRQSPPVLEQRTLYRKGKPFARGFQKVRG